MNYSKQQTMTGYTYIEDQGQTYLQCKVEAKAFCKSDVRLFRMSDIAVEIRIGVDRLYKIPSRGVSTITEKVYITIQTIILN